MFRKVCRRCDKLFMPLSRCSRYCEECKEEIKIERVEKTRKTLSQSHYMPNILTQIAEQRLKIKILIK